MIFLYPYFTMNKLSFTGLNVIIYNQSIAAVSPLVGGGRGGRGALKESSRGITKCFCSLYLVAWLSLLLFPLLPHCFVGVVLTSAWRWALAWVVTAKIVALRCRYLHGTYPLVQLMRCFEYVFRSFFPDIRKRRTHVDLRRTYKQNGRTAIIATLVILSLLQFLLVLVFFGGRKFKDVVYLA